MGGKGLKEELDNLKDTIKNLRKNVDKKEEGFASDAQRRAAFASGYKPKVKRKRKRVWETECLRNLKNIKVLKSNQLNSEVNRVWER